VCADGRRGQRRSEGRGQSQGSCPLRRGPEHAQVVPARLAAGAAAPAAVVAAVALRGTRLGLELGRYHFGGAVASLERHHARSHHDEAYNTKVSNLLIIFLSEHELIFEQFKRLNSFKFKIFK